MRCACDALLLLLRQGFTLVGTGCAVGLLAAFGVVRLLRSLLTTVQPEQPALLLAPVVALFAVAFVASCIPA